LSKCEQNTKWHEEKFKSSNRNAKTVPVRFSKEEDGDACFSSLATPILYFCETCTPILWKFQLSTKMSKNYIIFDTAQLEINDQNRKQVSRKMSIKGKLGMMRGKGDERNCAAYSM
jgi:hypothetical protein